MSLQNLSGQSLGQYALRDLLGVGGMGAVYRAYQENLDRFVAVKILSASLVSDREYLQRFIREARTAASLEHPHIIPVYDYGTHEGISYVVMRLLTGGSLAERLQHSRDTGRPLPSLEEVISILRQLASALDYAHARGVIHRDIKTSNVMFDDQGTAFVVDFGIAKLTHATSALTGTGMAMGTPLYMAPEQWSGAEITPAADQYALAVLIYNTLTDRMPFEGDTPFALMHKHLYEEPTPLGLLRPDLSEEARSVIKQAMAKTPSERYPSTTAFAAAFADSVGVQGGQHTGFFVTPLPRKPLPPAFAVSAGSVVVDGPTITPAPILAGTPAPAASGSGPVAAEAAGEPPVRRRSGALIGVVGLLTLLLVGAGLLALSVLGGAGLPPETATAQAAGTSARATADEEKAVGLRLSATALVVRASATRTPTATPTPTPPPREIAQRTRSAFQTMTATQWTRTPTPNATQTLRAELTGLYLLDLTETATLWTRTPTATATPSRTPSNTPTPTATATPSNTPTVTPTVTPSNTPTVTPSNTPTVTPSNTPTVTPSNTPTVTPSDTPTATPSNTPTVTPSNTPTVTPSNTPTATPSDTPTATPSDTPTVTPSNTPTVTPSDTPTVTVTPSRTPDLEATANARVTQVFRDLTATARAQARRATPTRVAVLPPTPRPVPTACSGAPPSRLLPGDEGFVPSDDDRPVNVRSGPGTSNPRIGQIFVNERFEVIEGPRCADGYAWYRVTYGGGILEGWVAEGDSQVYYIAPVVSSRPSSGVQSGQGQASTGAGTACEVIVEDTFDGDRTTHDWFRGTADRSVVRIEDGAYQVVLAETPGDDESVSWGSLRGFEFEDADVEAVVRASEFSSTAPTRTGLWVRYQNETEFVAFMIRGDGAYRIARWQDGSYRDLIPWTRAETVRTGDNVTNAMRVSMRGNRFDLYLNDDFIVSVTDATYQGGRVAFWGASEITPMIFSLDYFRVCRN